MGTVGFTAMWPILLFLVPSYLMISFLLLGGRFWPPTALHWLELIAVWAPWALAALAPMVAWGCFLAKKPAHALLFGALLQTPFFLFWGIGRLLPGDAIFGLLR